MKKMKFNHSVVLPIYNENIKVICKLIDEINLKISKCYIIIVDDSSNNKVKNYKLSKKYKNLKYFKREKKFGRGSAVLFGYKYLYKNIKPKYFAEIDTDQSHSVNDLKLIFNEINKGIHQCVLASRYNKNSKITGWPITRRIFSKTSNLLIRFFIFWEIKDYTNGLRVYSYKIIKDIISNEKLFLNIEFSILIESICFLKVNKYKIKEVKSHFKNRSKGKSSITFKQILFSFIFLFYIAYMKISKKYFI